MPILNRRRVILAKIEGTYGVDSAPTGAANAILVRSLDVTPLDADVVSRDVVRPFLGSQGNLIAGQKVTVSMEIELAGSGTAGSAPAYGPLLRACGLAEVLTAAPVTGTAQAGTTTSITLAVAGTSAVDNAYVGMPIAITAGTGSGQTNTIVAYNGTTKVATVAYPFTTAPGVTSTYSIGANVIYKPVSSGFESVTLWVQLQDMIAASSPTHKIVGCRGNVEMGMTAKQIPTLKFTFTGIYGSPADVANLAATYTPFRTPLPVNKQNTPVFNIAGLAAVGSELSMNLTNDVVYRNLIGSESVLLTNRDAKGSATFEAPTITAKDFFSAAISTSYVSMAVTHGTTAGNIVDFSSASVNVLNPSYSEMDGIVMMQMPYELVAVNGGDELFICIR